MWQLHSSSALGFGSARCHLSLSTLMPCAQGAVGWYPCCWKPGTPVSCLHARPPGASPSPAPSPPLCVVCESACCGRDLRRAGHLGEFVHIHLLNDACYISADGGRVCRPLIICDNGVPRVRDEHIGKLKSGEWGFQDFLRAGEALCMWQWCRALYPAGVHMTVHMVGKVTAKASVCA